MDSIPRGYLAIQTPFNERRDDGDRRKPRTGSIPTHNLDPGRWNDQIKGEPYLPWSIYPLKDETYLMVVKIKDVRKFYHIRTVWLSDNFWIGGDCISFIEVDLETAYKMYADPEVAVTLMAV